MIKVMEDFLILDFSKINTLPEIILLTTITAGIIGLVVYLLRKKDIEAKQKIDEETIKSYENALKAVREDLTSRLDHCEVMHTSSQTQINDLKKENAALQGQIKVLSTLPLEKITTTLDTMNTALSQPIVTGKQIGRAHV